MTHILILSVIQEASVLLFFCFNQSEESKSNKSFFHLFLFKTITASLLESVGKTSALMVFISINLFGFLAKCVNFVFEALLAALVRGVVLKKKAALVFPTLTGEPSSKVVTRFLGTFSKWKG